MHRIHLIIAAILGCLVVSLPSYAQINNNFINTAPPGAESTTQQNNSQSDEVIMSTKPAFNIKRYFSALAHKDSMNVAQMAIGSMILPGTAQIYNKQYWKLPIVYGSIGACVGGAIASKGKDSQKYFIAGALACYWGLCKLGDAAEKRGVSRFIVWPAVVLLCTLAGCELLWSITGLWVVTCPYSTLAWFGGLLFLCTLGLLCTSRSIIKGRTALHAIYGGLVLINAFWFLHSWADGELLTRHGVFGKTSARASWDNPLLPADSWNPPYHSWLFEPGRVITSAKSQQHSL